MKIMVQILARRRFNYIDGTSFAWAPAFIVSGWYWSAAAVYFGGLLLSIIIEGIARSDKFGSDH